MATYQKRKKRDGSTSVIAWVRIKGFRTASRAFPTKPHARRWARALEGELRRQRDHADARKDLAALTVRGLIEEFLADPQTRRLKYQPDLRRLLAWWANRYGSEKVLNLGVPKLREARELVRNGRAAATVNRYLAALRSCWNWGRAAGLVPHENSWPRRRLFLTEPRGRVRFLSDEELSATLAAAQKMSPWIHAAIVVSVATGVRMGELLRVQWRDLDLEKLTLTVHASRTDKRRLVHLNEPAAAALKNLRRTGPVDTRWVFVTETGAQADKFYLSYRWRQVREAAGLRDFRWHDLRHCTASYLAQDGATLAEIGSVLGHSTPSVTARYAHLVAGRSDEGR